MNGTSIESLNEHVLGRFFSVDNGPCERQSPLPLTISTMSDAAHLATTAHAFNKILSQPKLSSKTRTPEDVEESVKKLRRLILIDGIPSRAVCARLNRRSVCSSAYCDLCRIPHFDTEYGKSC